MNLHKMTADKIVCTVCKQQKQQLRARKSKLSPGLQMYLCNTCFTAGYEPRYLVIIVGQDEGIQAVQKHLVNHLYYGKEITAADLIK